MDTFKIIGEINKDISRLDERINSTDKSATIAFSYLLTKTDHINEELANNSYQMSKVITDSSFIKDQIITLQENFLTVSNNNTNICYLSDGMKGDIYSLNTKNAEYEKKIEELNKRIVELENKLANTMIIDTGYIIIKKEEGFIERTYKKISNFFYKLFKVKKVIEKKEELKEKEIQRKVEENQSKIKEQIKKKQEAKDTINNLLK